MWWVLQNLKKKKGTSFLSIAKVSTANPGDSDIKPKQNKADKCSCCSHLF